jgi:hypothetical protein
VRVLLGALIIAAAIYFSPHVLTKENFVILVVGLLTAIGLLRVLTHETRGAAEEVFPALTEITEGYYGFRTKLRSLQDEFQRSRPDDAG